jgi:hypothetical protein
MRPLGELQRYASPYCGNTAWKTDLAADSMSWATLPGSRGCCDSEAAARRSNGAADGMSAGGVGRRESSTRSWFEFGCCGCDDPGEPKVSFGGAETMIGGGSGRTAGVSGADACGATTTRGVSALRTASCRGARSFMPRSRSITARARSLASGALVVVSTGGLAATAAAVAGAADTAGCTAGGTFPGTDLATVFSRGA